MFRLFNHTATNNNPQGISNSNSQSIHPVIKEVTVELPIVELSDNVNIHTEIKTENWPALRAGFAGYPRNPRWNARKFHAWKTGCQLRSALDAGEMAVCPLDQLLMDASQVSEQVSHNLCEEIAQSNPEKSGKIWSKIAKFNWHHLLAITLKKPVMLVRS